MKWFQHYTDSHTNGKMRMILRKHGIAGYGFCWICRELVAKEGTKNRLKAEKDWKTTLGEVVKLPQEEIEELLKYQAEIGAIDRKALEIGDLYIPKLGEYSDVYTKRVRREYAQGTDNVPVDKITIDKIIKEYIHKKSIPLVLENGTPEEKAATSAFWKRNVRTAKNLAILSKGNAQQVIDAMEWFGGLCERKNLSWSLETIEKWFPDFMAKGKAIENIPESLREYLR